MRGGPKGADDHFFRPGALQDEAADQDVVAGPDLRTSGNVGEMAIACWRRGERWFAIECLYPGDIVGLQTIDVTYVRIHNRVHLLRWLRLIGMIQPENMTELVQRNSMQIIESTLAVELHWAAIRIETKVRIEDHIALGHLCAAALNQGDGERTGIK